MNRPRRAREEVSAGGVVFRREGSETYFLLIRDSYRNWGFPKGHLEQGEGPEQAALREVGEETGLEGLELRAPIEVIDWEFRFRGRRIHKTCHFFLIETPDQSCQPLRAEGITACRWAPFTEAVRLIAYDNARQVLRQAQAILVDDRAETTPQASTSASTTTELPH